MTNTKTLYPYQEAALREIFDRFDRAESALRLVYQLPTGGGKTVIFSAIAQRFIQDYGQRVLILTHRVELSKQTSGILTEFGINHITIDRFTQPWEAKDSPDCYVAMIETLSNRLSDKKFSFEGIGLVIVDEAHHNSFQKIFHRFEQARFIGVTATPLSSNNKNPMHDFYTELMVGAPISKLIDDGYLARAETVHYPVGLTNLKVGSNGDYTVKSSDELYGSKLMIDKLFEAYKDNAFKKKTLIFNNGIATSVGVANYFRKVGIPVEHLDHSATAEERRRILRWFHKTPGAVVSSVSILTTGFDEPSVECIILNRATKSLTLYFQMIGRGSRRIHGKNHFTLIDLGNNVERFGPWESPLNWRDVFLHPDFYVQSMRSDEEIEQFMVFELPQAVRQKFKHPEKFRFDVEAVYHEITRQQLRPKAVLDRSLDNHFEICIESAHSYQEAKALSLLLFDDIQYRIRSYVRLLGKTTSNYQQWLADEYLEKLRRLLHQHFRALES